MLPLWWPAPHHVKAIDGTSGSEATTTSPRLPLDQTRCTMVAPREMGLAANQRRGLHEHFDLDKILDANSAILVVNNSTKAHMRARAQGTVFHCEMLVVEPSTLEVFKMPRRLSFSHPNWTFDMSIMIFSPS